MILTDDNFCSIVKAVEKGRVIYSGIQKFVAFIMSVHIAEVMQIFFCIVTGVPVMRTPLQILFLILVTDLPPSIALGMEPGEKTILKERPRPKDEPVVLGWMWLSMVMNGAVLSIVIIIVYIISLSRYCDGSVFQEDIAQLEDSSTKLMKARTVAFISLVWSENVRSYTSRSFNRPIWHDMFGNSHMQKAIILAQLCLYAAVLIPFFSDHILELSGLAVGWEGWLLAIIGPLGCLVMCELCKIITAFQVGNYQKRLAERHEAEDHRLAEASRDHHRKSGGAVFNDKAAGGIMVQAAAPAPVVPMALAAKSSGHDASRQTVHKVVDKLGRVEEPRVHGPADVTEASMKKRAGVVTMPFCSCFGLFPTPKVHVVYSLGIQN
mmetsp:Transcript_81079/g.247745  ORF Transcript_81079/g.247745 Transcript_81079/m.247745 type:complete len:379 (-) Transcript_81079:18-1154(-)